MHLDLLCHLSFDPSLIVWCLLFGIFIIIGSFLSIENNQYNIIKHIFAINDMYLKMIHIYIFLPIVILIIYMNNLELYKCLYTMLSILSIYDLLITIINIIHINITLIIQLSCSIISILINFIYQPNNLLLLLIFFIFNKDYTC